MFGKRHKDISRQRVSISKKGQRASIRTEFKAGLIPWNKGKHMPESIRGKNHYNWKGGADVRNELSRKSMEIRIWRETVFKRDDYTCQMCGKRGVELQADHELPFALYPDLRFELLNGQTLCVACHREKTKSDRIFLKQIPICIQ